MVSPDEESECRICRGGAEPGRPLFHPCKCSGSIKFIHENCLVTWLAESRSAQCELCHHPFRFEQLYHPDTPTMLPTHEFFFGIISRIKGGLRMAARIFLVFIVWIFLLPVLTCWTWYALFIDSPTHLPILVVARGLSGLITDAFRGCVLSIGIVFVFLGVSSLRDYVRQLPDEEMDHAFDELSDDEEDAEFLAQDPEHARAHGHPHNPAGNALPQPPGPAPGEHPAFAPAAAAARNPFAGAAGYDGVHDDFTDNGPPAPHDIVTGLPLNVEEPPAVTEMDDLLRDTFDAMGQDDDDFDDVDEGEPNEDNGDPEMIAFDQLQNGRGGDPNLAHLREPGFPDAGAHAGVFHDFPGSDSDSDGMFDYPEMDPGLVQDEDDEAEVVPEPNDEGEAGEGGALFGLFDLDPEEVPLEEVVGLRGQLRNLFDHAGTVLLSNALFLGIFTFIPLCIGRVTLRLLSFRSFPVPSTLKAFGISGANSSETMTAVSNVADSVLKNGSPILHVLKSGLGRNSSFLASTVGYFSSVSSDLHHAYVAAQNKGNPEPLMSNADNFLVVLLGYGVLSLGAIAYVIINSLLRSRYPRFDSPMTRYIAGMLRYVATLVKILVLILFEFGIFPLGCGWWLDICTLDLVGGTLQSRISFCHMVPWLCTAGHWFLGIVFMVHISLFVSLLREVLRPELLWFLRNPDDPDFHPFRELVEKPLSRHARRMCLSVLIYVPLVAGIVFVPGQLCLKLLPQVFPLRFDDFSHSLIDVPFGNLLVVPLISLVHHTRPGVFLHKALKFWIDEVGNALGIAHLVAKQDDGNAQENPNVDVPADAAAPLLRAPDNEEYWSTSESEREDDYAGDDDDAVEPPVADARLRGFIMFTLAWATMVFCECLVLAIPTVTGRAILRFIGLPVHHDLHSYGAGFYVLLMSLEFSAQARAFLRTVDTPTLFRTALPRVKMAIKGAFVVILWLGVVPLLAGVLLELTITVPLRVPFNETPYLYLHQDWALGLLIMKLWNKVVLAGRLNGDWRQRVERAREGGVLGMGPNFPRTLQEVVLPVLMWTLIALCLPYTFAQGVLPLLGCSTFVSNVVYRFIYVGIAAVYGVQVAMRSLLRAMRGLHDSIRDDKYLIGKRLYNFSDNFGGGHR